MTDLPMVPDSTIWHQPRIPMDIKHPLETTMSILPVRFGTPSSCAGSILMNPVLSLDHAVDKDGE